MVRGVSTIALVCLAVSAYSAPARAAMPKTKTNPMAKPVTAIKKPPEGESGVAAKEKAKPFAAEGKRQYKLGRFQESLEAYSRAYEIFPAPALLFNLGQCEKNLNNYKRAIFFFEGYLRDEQRPEARATAEALVSEAKVSLESQQMAKLAADEELARQEQLKIATEEAIAASQPAPGLSAPVVTPLSKRVWFWPVIGGGSAVAVGVVSFFVISYAIAPHPPKTRLGTVTIQ